MTEFNLSDKRIYDFNGNLSEKTKYCYTEQDVKEFIKKLKTKVYVMDLGGYGKEIMLYIDKLAGEKLI